MVDDIDRIEVIRGPGAAMWGAWATDLDHRTVSSGHFMAEEAPGEVIGAVRDLLAR